jgi:hypothetical protein
MVHLTFQIDESRRKAAANIMPYRKKPVVYDNTGRAFFYTVFSDSGTFV